MAPAGGIPLPAGDLPHLTLREPESTRTAILSGSISALLHCLAIGFFALLAWMAPEITRVISVKIVELPGSDREPAPAPRQIVERQAMASPSLAARVQQAVQPTAMAAQAVSAESLQMTEIDPSVSPAEVRRTQATSAPVTALTSLTGPRVSAAEMGIVQPVDLQLGDLTAPVLHQQGPRRVAQRTQVEAGAQQVVAVFDAVGKVDYEAVADAGEVSNAPIGSISIDTDVESGFASSGGGEGTELGTARCLESAYVHRYWETMQARTKVRWTIPQGTPPGTKVILRFELDASGTATKVEYDDTVNSKLGASAVAAMRAASPFPAMDDSVRCLAGMRLRATFDAPAS